MERSKKIQITYILFVISIFLLCLIYANFNQVNSLIDDNNEIVFSQLQFDHADLVSNLYHGEGFYQYRFGIKYHLAKMPVLPLMVALISLISKNIYFIYFIKNLILFSIIFFSINFYCKNHNTKTLYFLIFLISFFIVPHNLHVLLNINFADTIVASLLPSLFLLLATQDGKKYIFISILLFFLYLSKTSMFFLCLLIPFLIVILENGKFQKKILPIISLFLAISIWGSFGLAKTGTFSFGSKILSVSSEGLSIALNKQFHNFYPKKSVDLIKIPKIEENKFKNEWEVYEFYKKKNNEYLKNNLNRYLKDTLIKIKVILFNIKKDSSFPNQDNKYQNPIQISFIINKLIFNISLITALIIIYKKLKFFNNIKDFKSIKTEIYLIFIIGLNSLPLIIGWATAKHLTGMTLVCLVYLFLKTNDYLIKN